MCELQETLEATNEKKLRLVDWVENNALVDWVTPCSSHIPKASTRLEIGTSVKHGLDQILTSTQPAGPTVVSWVSIDLHAGFVWCHPTPSSLPLHMFPPKVNWSPLNYQPLLQPNGKILSTKSFDSFQEGADFTVVNPVSNIDLNKCVWCHWTPMLFHACRVCVTPEVSPFQGN